MDIEGTLIEDFDNPTILHENKEQVSLLARDNENVLCFSWAINNAHDLAVRKHIIENIEKEFGFKFKSFVFRDSLFQMFKHRFGIGLDFNEFEDICRSLGKEIVFQMFVRKILKDENEQANFTLLDDTVENTVLILNNQTITTIKI